LHDETGSPLGFSPQLQRPPETAQRHARQLHWVVSPSTFVSAVHVIGAPTVEASHFATFFQSAARWFSSSSFARHSHVRSFRLK
jgi:hypothetical protein